MLLFSISDTGDSEENNFSSPIWSRTYDLLVINPDALPLSYRSLVGAKAFFFSSESPVSLIENNIISHLFTRLKIHHH